MAAGSRIDTNPSSGRERIVLAAESMMAEHGAGVALRDIAVAAGQKNNSAVQYYFTDRDGLIDAVVAYRLAPLEARRVELVADLDAKGLADDPKGLLFALVLPMFEVPYEHGATHYARFLEKVRDRASVQDHFRLEAPHGASVRIIITRLVRALRHLSLPLREQRIRALTTVLFGLLADHERAMEANDPRPDDVALVRADIIDTLMAMLFAPAPSKADQEAVAPSVRATRKRNANTDASREAKAHKGLKPQ